MKKLKILFVLTSLGFGGIQEHVRQVIKNIDKDKFEIWIAHGIPDSNCEKLSSLGVKLVNIGMVKPISPKKDFISLVRLIKLMRQNKFHIVHTHMSKSSIIGRLAAKLTGVKFTIITAHGWTGILDYFYSSRLARIIFYTVEWTWARLFTDHVILVSQSDFAEIIKRKLVHEHKITVIENGVDIEECVKGAGDRDKVLQELKIPEDAKVIVMVGRLCRQKAPEVFLNAADKIIQRRKDVFFLLAGDGPRYDEMKQMAYSLADPSRFFLLGNRGDIYSLLKASDIFALPSIYEGMPISILEAMVLGSAVVATNIDGNSDLVKHEKTGLLIDVGDVDSMALSIERLIDDERLRKNLVDSARSMIENTYNSKDMGQRTQKIYIEGLKKYG